MAAKSDTSAGGSDRPSAVPGSGRAEPGNPVEQSAVVLAAIRRLLRPVVRWLISHQVTYPMLSSLLKEVYVDVAERDFPLARDPEKRVTDSRVTLMTGVHRKDVARLRSSGEPSDEQTPATVSLGAQLVARWLADPRCVDERGRALALPRRDSGDGPSFEGLVRSVSTDIRARAVLDEWLRLGIAELDDAGRVRLRHDAFVPEAGFEEKSHFLSWNVHDHLAAAFENLSRGEASDDSGSSEIESPPNAPFLERAVFYAHLRPESVSELSEIAREHGIQALKVVNRRAAELQQNDEGHETANQRMRFGSYFYAAELEADPSSEIPGGVDDAPDDATKDRSR